ncbi:Phosphoribosylformylglycinamidine synthase 2 [Candidatus Sulfotelmatobacter kueseliae]|uniref:Phosphoribosylformylglycinamidine synthase subunit PurL n=1 Tax=Candidatus Sulfotelmatobacter kueseliae TaxID=2042962 RepID=A0A2U3KFK1_9BACT|nr:Phosphoribosylformylglycinamidine synthase 2 [Candidatus Sulfotelmatobacter kueseliae]
MATTLTSAFSPETIRQHGLTLDEYEKIKQLLGGREPTFTELGIFSVMWSEHCSYKSSRVHLKRLPTRSKRVLQGPGENAGIIDVGDGWACAFKIESHNHPSFIEPFQGATTGVGGILRDIFTMGARPVAVMDSLRFGPITAHGTPDALVRGNGSATLAGQTKASAPTQAEVHRNHSILEGVVSGIASYGNCFGVPNLGGETKFEPCYSGNPLVNAFALGLVRKDQIFYARAAGAGNPVIYVGAKTGRDGIHGATMASEEFSEASEAKRPNVQVGDPFLEKLLLEACLEAMQTGAIVGIQDMGAAGLTCSTCEMGGRGKVGIEIELDRVPQRETGMTPYEIMLSESQERMLLVAQKGREQEVFRVFEKWGLDAVEVGKVTTDNKLRVLQHGQVVAEIPNPALTDDAPVYQRPLARWEPPVLREIPELVRLGGVSDFTATLKRLLASPNICGKRWVWQQYDHMVQTNTVEAPGAGDAGVIRIKGSQRGLAMSLDGNGRWCYLDPRLGAMHAVAESARKVACAGATPVGATNCLNFGNPEKPHIMWQFSQTIDGMTKACEELEIPITGGNVSFYNETLGEGIYPTPVLGVVGVLDDVHKTVHMHFSAPGRTIVLLRAGEPGDITDAESEFGSSEYAKEILGALWGYPPEIDLEKEASLQKTVIELIQQGLVDSAHDCSEGGLAVALAEKAFPKRVGARVNLASAGLPAEFALFGEDASRIVVSCDPANLTRIKEVAEKHGVAADEIGETIPETLEIALDGGVAVSVVVSELSTAYEGALESALRTDPELVAAD